MNFKEKISEVKSSGWSGMKYSSVREELIRLYELLDFFVEKTTNEYLNQNEKTVIKSIKSDNPPRFFLEILLEKEKSDKNRRKVINEINKRL